MTEVTFLFFVFNKYESIEECRWKMKLHLSVLLAVSICDFCEKKKLNSQFLKVTIIFFYICFDANFYYWSFAASVVIISNISNFVVLLLKSIFYYCAGEGSCHVGSKTNAWFTIRIGRRSGIARWSIAQSDPIEGSIGESARNRSRETDQSQQRINTSIHPRQDLMRTCFWEVKKKTPQTQRGL